MSNFNFMKSALFLHLHDALQLPVGKKLRRKFQHQTSETEVFMILMETNCVRLPQILLFIKNPA